MEFVKGLDIFDIVEELDKNGQKIYRLRFKNDGTEIRKGYMSTSAYTVEYEADRWVKRNKNHQRILDVLFEKDVLNA